MWPFLIFFGREVKFASFITSYWGTVASPWASFWPCPMSPIDNAWNKQMQRWGKVEREREVGFQGGYRRLVPFFLKTHSFLDIRNMIKLWLKHDNYILSIDKFSVRNVLNSNRNPSRLVPWLFLCWWLKKPAVPWHRHWKCCDLSPSRGRFGSDQDFQTFIWREDLLQCASSSFGRRSTSTWGPRVTRYGRMWFRKCDGRNGTNGPSTSICVTNGNATNATTHAARQF